MPDTIVYATSLLPAAEMHTRIARAHQSAAAQALLESLKAGFAPRISSKSHSRTAIAAAAGTAGITNLGVDLEYMDPARPFAALAGFLIGAETMPVGAAGFYRCWTFAEAHFKAFQKLPLEGGIRRVAALSDSDERCQLDDGTHVLLQRIADRFQLCLVWRSTHDACELRYLQP
jgi:hypothetical protein